MENFLTILGVEVSKEFCMYYLRPYLKTLEKNHLREKLKEKLKQIPEENRQTPKSKILIPAIQTLAYNVDEEEIKKMFLNLISNSADNRKKVDPSFIEMLKQMDELDAKLFKILFDNKKVHNVVADVRLFELILSENEKDNRTKKEVKNEFLPQWFFGENFIIENYDIFDISRSLTKLEKLGLIEIDRPRGVISYEDSMKKESMTILYNILKSNGYSDDFFIQCYKNNHIIINDYGKHFGEICLS